MATSPIFNFFRAGLYTQSTAGYTEVVSQRTTSTYTKTVKVPH